MIKQIFNDVKDDWRDILLSKKAKPILKDILEELQDLDNITPKLTDIFTFAKIQHLNDAKVVIIGQDPYPGSDQAHGLAFSTLDEKTPVSLRKIFQCLVETEVLDEKPSINNLTRWSKQGIILLNTSLTTLVDKPNKHSDIWREYTDLLIQSISDTCNDLIWCLFGNFAKEKSKFIDTEKHTILTFCHPVAYPPNDFTKCDHFVKIIEKYPNLDLSLKPIKSIFATDGACPNNGKENAQAAWGAVCYKGPLAGLDFGKKLKHKMIEQKISIKDPKTGKKTSKVQLIKTNMTNIRAEGLALINVLKLIKKYNLIDETNIIYSDSKFWINDMLNEYIPKWVNKGEPWSNHANSDLTESFWNLNQEIKPTYIFCNAWHDYPKPNKKTKHLDGKSRLAWKLNKLAEKAAQARL